MKRKKITVVTGSRSDFGPLLPLLNELKASKKIDLKVVATGSHLSKKHGKTIALVVEAGIKVDHKIPSLGSGDDYKDVLKCVSNGMAPFFDYFACTQPDAILLLGDRFDIFAPAFAAYISRIPIIHLYGGEVTEGAFDEGIRHSITKLSSLHFVANEKYRSRVIQLGEDPKRVIVSGSLGLDNIRKLKTLTKTELKKTHGIQWGKKNILVTYHPTTQKPGQARKEFKNILDALEEMKDVTAIFTAPNADSGGAVILEMIKEFVSSRPKQAYFFHSLGSQFYISLCANVDLVLGNSSSGLIEVPALGAMTVNVGDRQKGRERGNSVVDATPSKTDILNKCRRILNGSYRKLEITNPYDQGIASRKIVRVIENANFDRLKDKSFYDLKGIR